MEELVNNTQKTANSPQANFHDEGGVELREHHGESSIAPAFTGREDTSKEDTSILLERILDRDNLNRAYKRVVKNGGSSGVDGMEVEELLPYLKQHGDQLKQQLTNGTYRPQPVRRVEIPKAEGGVRLLGIPTVLDRMIQQAIAQVISPIFEKEFSEHSYGFRPGRNAHQAIKHAQVYMNEGYTTVVDIDLEKFFDRVNHDKLMYLVSKQVRDKRVLKLVRTYLESGVMIGGLVSSTDEGTPQGGPISPLLSNVMLNELDKELEKRGHRFCRYADDCNIYVKSIRAGERVMSSITEFIEKRLKLKVNREKSAVDSSKRRKFLGFSFYRKEEGTGIRVHPKPIKRFKEKVKSITGRCNGWSMNARIERLNRAIRGWVTYFSIADMRGHCEKLDGWIRRRLRMCYWKQWKKLKTRHNNLVCLGLSDRQAWQFANTRKSYWHTSKSPILATTLTNEYFRELGYVSLVRVYNSSR